MPPRRLRCLITEVRLQMRLIVFLPPSSTTGWIFRRSGVELPDLPTERWRKLLENSADLLIVLCLRARHRNFDL